MLKKNTICLSLVLALLANTAAAASSAGCVYAGSDAAAPGRTEKAVPGDCGFRKYGGLGNAVPEYPDAAEAQNAVNGIARKYGAVGAEVAVISGGKVAGTYAYGSATKSVRSMTADTKIRVASISKVVLGMVAMSLREDGVIGLDEDIGRYWGKTIRNPYYRDVPVTIHSLLSHTSSIQIYGSGVKQDGASIRSRLTSGSCFNRSMPGAIASWGYNNYGFAVLGVTLELAAGETINRIADRKLFGPLDIAASFGCSAIDISQLATLYYHSGFVAKSVNSLKSMAGNKSPGQSGMNFAGGLVISASDLAKLVAVLANDGVYNGRRILSAESVALMETVDPQKVSDAPFYQGLPLRYQTSVYGQDSLYYHTGSAYGAYNLMSYNPDTKNGVVVLTTGASSAKDNYGIYKVCGELSEYFYSDMDKTNTEDAPPDPWGHVNDDQYRLPAADTTPE